MIKGEVIGESEDYEVVVVTREDGDNDELPDTFYGLFNKNWGVLEQMGHTLPSVLSWMASLQQQLYDLQEGHTSHQDGEVVLPNITTIQ